MNADKIIELVAKGMVLIEAVRQASEAASPAIKALAALVEKNSTGGTITEAEVKAVEDLLDQQLNDFNSPLPEDV
jgi:hypothetical protein